MKTVQAKTITPSQMHQFTYGGLYIDCGRIEELPTKVIHPDITDDMTISAYEYYDYDPSERWYGQPLVVSTENGYLTLEGKNIAPFSMKMSFVHGNRD